MGQISNRKANMYTYTIILFEKYTVIFEDANSEKIDPSLGIEPMDMLAFIVTVMAEPPCCL